MFSSLKRFDVHVKSVEGVNQQTILGAVITIFSTILICVLIFSEISYFMKIDVVSRMLTDKSANVESVKLEFDLQFYDIACDRINFIQEVTRGTLHIHEPGVVEKYALDDGITLGCHVRGANLIDKVGGNFRFAIEPAFFSQNGEVLPGRSSNFSHTVRHVAFVPTMGDSAADKLPELVESLRDQESLVPAGSGLYHYAIQVSTRTSCVYISCFLSTKVHENMNMYDSTVSNESLSLSNLYLFVFATQVVPTQYKTLYGALSFLNQYSVIEKAVPWEQMERVEPIQGLHLRDFQGIVFTYDFHPVMLYMEERRERIIDFVSNLFGIVGGVITVLR